MTVVYVCGPAQGTDGAMRCPCCGFESKDPEAFATSTCWPCSLGGNLECESCVSLGVGVDRFSTPNTKIHRLSAVIRRGEDAVTSCGLRIPYEDMGQGTAVRKPCQRCWGDREWL